MSRRRVPARPKAAGTLPLGMASSGTRAAAGVPPPQEQGWSAPLEFRLQAARRLLARSKSRDVRRRKLELQHRVSSLALDWGDALRLHYSDAARSLALMLMAEGHECRTTFDGPSALALAAEFRPAVFVLDIGMPGMDGLEVAQRLRADPGFSDSLMIAVTGWGQEEDRQRSQKAGFDHHLVKPVAFDELSRLLAGPRAVPASPSPGQIERVSA